MPHDTCFLGHFLCRYRWQQSFDPMTSPSLTFDGGHVKIRLDFEINIFTQKKHMFLAQNVLRIPNMSLAFLYDA